MNRSILLLLTCAGCSGLLVIPEPKAPAIPCTTSAQCGVGLICDTVLDQCVISPGGCSVSQPDGDCPSGRLCVDGACLCVDADVCQCATPDCSIPPTWCDCLPTQGCNTQGECIDIPPGGDCAPTRPNGLCANGENCIGGYCQPCADPCSDQNPKGCCKSGLTCVEGYCIPTYESPCSHDNPTGLCPSGQECVDPPGQCEVIQCAPGVLGACPQDEGCNLDCTQLPCCEQLTCSPHHLGGACTNGQYCAKCGDCRDPGICCVDLDCLPNQYCGTTTVCSDLGDCVVDDDCEVKQPAPNFGQGYECVSGGCSERLTCTITEDCIPTKYCSSTDHCLLFPACDDDTDCQNINPLQVCSTSGQCIDSGTCLLDGDCKDVNNPLCSHNHSCIPPGECRVDQDCPPGRGCTTPPTCTVTGTPTPCSTNAVKYAGCPSDPSSCCDPATSTDCCPAGQICSLVTGEELCIPMGKCVTAADCLSGYFDCVKWECVPTKLCSDCTARDICRGGNSVQRRRGLYSERPMRHQQGLRDGRGLRRLVALRAGAGLRPESSVDRRPGAAQHPRGPRPF